MQCLLQVVKWLTKCLFYSWLLKICTGLSLLFSSFVHDMFCFANVPTSIPADCSCHRLLQTLEAVEGACAWRQKQVHTQQTLTPYFCLQISTSLSSLFIRETSINVSLLQGNIQQEDSCIYPTICCWSP